MILGFPPVKVMSQSRYNDIFKVSHIKLISIPFSFVFLKKTICKCLVHNPKLKKQKLNILTVTQPLEAPFILPI